MQLRHNKSFSQRRFGTCDRLVNVNCNTCAFPSMTSQNVCCEKGLLRLPFPLLCLMIMFFSYLLDDVGHTVPVCQFDVVSSVHQALVPLRSNFEIVF